MAAVPEILSTADQWMKTTVIDEIQKNFPMESYLLMKFKKFNVKIHPTDNHVISDKSGFPPAYRLYAEGGSIKHDAYGALDGENFQVYKIGQEDKNNKKLLLDYMK